MKILDNVFLEDKIDDNTYIAIGAFDGIHKGHRKVIKEAVEKAKKCGGKSLVFTFANHPLEIVDKARAPRMISTKEERVYILEELGVDYVVFQPFNLEFASITPEVFVRDILKGKLNAKEIFVGFNFAFGKGGKAKVEDLERLGNEVGITTNIMKAVSNKEEVISSTLIRKLIELGKIEEVNKHLGYELMMLGEVVHGKKLGRQMGFPTANLEIQDRIYPPIGIYGARVVIEGEEGEWDAVVNIGKNPTLKPGIHSIEVHILDFDRYIYGKKICIKLIKYQREEKKFSSMEELKAVINNDVRTWRRYLKEVDDAGF